MSGTRVLLSESISISERFRVELKVYEVDSSKKYPEGIKAKFVLIDVINKQPLLLVDNHEPYGFHIHEELPDNKHQRTVLETKDFNEALEVFWTQTWKVLEYED